MTLFIHTTIIVAFITLLGTIITAIGKDLLKRIWPDEKEGD
jgi:hypothetical protein